MMWIRELLGHHGLKDGPRTKARAVIEAGFAQIGEHDTAKFSEMLRHIPEERISVQKMRKINNGVFKSLRIVIHGNWYPLFRDFFAQIAEDHDELNFNVNNTNARGNTSVYMGTKRSHRYLTEFGLMHDLPLMKRKWVAPTVLR